MPTVTWFGEPKAEIIFGFHIGSSHFSTIVIADQLELLTNLLAQNQA